MQSRGITALPVTIIDDDEVIIGYYPKKLIPALRLEIQVDLSGLGVHLAVTATPGGLGRDGVDDIDAHGVPFRLSDTFARRARR